MCPQADLECGAETTLCTWRFKSLLVFGELLLFLAMVDTL